MAACVLALLIVAPTVSLAACVCQHEAPVIGVETSTAAGQTGQTVQGDQRDHGTPCKAACCVGGHCHHGGGLPDTPVEGVPAPAPVDVEHAMASAQALASRTISGPDRPPRA